MSRRWMPGVCFLAGSVAASAGLPIRAFTTSHGLPSNSINGIFQDSRGFIWIATDSGIARYDGRRIQVYPPGGPDRGAYARRFIEDRDGNVWAAGISGLLRFDGPDMANPAVFPGPGIAQMNTLMQDSDGLFWAGGPTGLYRFRAPRERQAPEFEPAGLNSKERPTAVFALLRDRDGSLWVSARDGLHLRERGQALRRIAAAHGLGGGLIEDGRGTIWATTGDRGILRIDPGGAGQDPIVRSCTSVHGLPTEMAFTVLETHDGRLLVGAHLGAVEHVGSTPASAPCSFQKTDDIQVSKSADVRVLFEDRDGGIWVGTESGVLHINLRGISTYGPAEGLISPSVQAVFTSRGQLFAVSDHIGIGQFDGRRFESVIPNVGVATQFPKRGWGAIQTILRDHAGEWWVPTAAGLYRFSGIRRLSDLRTAQPRIYAERDGLATAHLFRLFEDSRGTLWASAIGGPDYLAATDRGRHGFVPQIVIGESPRLPHGPVSAFRQDRSGALWVGFWRGGVARLRDAKWDYFSPGGGVPGGFVNDIVAVRDGTLWVGSAAGLTHVTNPDSAAPEFVTFTKQDGLSGTDVTCVAEDNEGLIYACTAIGVDRIDPRHFPGPVRRFSSLDGLPPSKPACAFRDPGGRIWFCTLEGLASFRPDLDHPRTVYPPVLVSMRVRGQGSIPLSWTGAGRPRFAAAHNDIEFEFAAPSPLGLPVRYRYRIRGLSDQWSEYDENGSVRLGGLPSGRYQLTVEGSGAGVATGESSLAEFEILPPVWRSWWFIGLAGIALTSAIYAAHRYRIRRVLELERVRMRIATDLHDELGADLSRLAVLSETARLNGGANDVLGRISEISRQMLDATADVVWTIRPGRDRLSDLVERMREFTNDLFGSDTVQFVFNAPADNVRLDPDIRRQVFSIFKETLNNIARHSGAKSVAIEMGLARRHLTLSVSDDGRGFRVDETATASRRHGVSGMRWRAGVMGARLDIASAPGAGTTVRLSVPLRKLAG